MTFDPKRRLVMATFKTVLGHNLPAGTALSIVDEPSARGEIDEAMARRLFASKNAVYFEDARPTPVETPEQEKARLALSEDQAAPDTGRKPAKGETAASGNATKSGTVGAAGKGEGSGPAPTGARTGACAGSEGEGD